MKPVYLYTQVKTEVKGVPKSQVTANPWCQEEEERETNQHPQNKHTWKAHTPELSIPSEVIAMLKGLKNTKIKMQGKA